jgi:hypothetical protein
MQHKAAIAFHVTDDFRVVIFILMGFIVVGCKHESTFAAKLTSIIGKGECGIAGFEFR